MKKVFSILIVFALLVTFIPEAAAMNSLTVNNFVITPNTTSSYPDIVLSITFTSDLTTNDYIYINFQTPGFSIPSTIDKQFVKINGETAGKVDVSDNGIKIYPVKAINAGTEVTVEIKPYSKIKNPENAGSYTFLIGVSNETSSVSEGETIQEGLKNLVVTVFPKTSNSNALYLISFYNSANTPLTAQGDYIAFIFPQSVFLPDNAQIKPSEISINNVPCSKVTVTANMLTVYIPPSVSVPSNSFASVKINPEFGIKNPEKPGEYLLKIFTSKTPIVNTFYNIEGTSIAHLNVQVTPAIQNANAEIKIIFTTSLEGNLAKNSDKIFIEMPTQFTCVNQPDFSKIYVNGVKVATGNIQDNKITITMGENIPVGSVIIDIKRAFGIKNPAIPGEYSFTVYTSKDLIPTSGKVTIEASHITAPVVTLTNYRVNSVSEYKITFFTGAGGMLKKGEDKVFVIFPEGTVVPQTISKNVEINDMAVEDITVSDNNTVELTVPINIQEGSKVNIVFKQDVGIKNPSNASTYTIEVYTSSETMPVISTGYEITALPQSKAVITPPSPNGKAGYYTVTPTVALSATSPVNASPTIYYYIDNNTPVKYTGKVIAIPDGIHSLHFYAIDAQGRKETPENVIQFKVDTVKPVITIASPKNNTTINGNSVVIHGITEKGAIVTVNGNIIPTSADGSFQFLATGKGSTTYTIKTIDLAGNENESKLTVIFNNSTPANPPNLTVSSPADGTTIYQLPVVVQGQTDKDTTVTVNGKAVTVEEDGSFTTSINVPQGENVIKVIASRNGKTKEVDVHIKYLKNVSIKLQIENKNAIVNGTVVSLDAPPIIKNSRTLVPLRFIGESFGATIKWDPVLKLIDIQFNDMSIKLQIGLLYASVNGKKVVLDAAPEITNGRTMVPLRFIVETFGASVTWDGTTKTITIVYPKTGG